MKKSSKISVFVAITLLVLGMAFFPSIKRMFSADRQEQSAVPVAGGGGGGGGQSGLVVNATILTPQNFTEVFRMTGVLLPDEEVDLTFEASGRITDILFREGTYVRRGELLAKINDAPLQAELRRLEAQLPLAQDRVRRQQTLLERDAISQETYQSVTTQLEVLRADIELVNARIRQTELRAPFDGVIGLRQVSEGTFATPSLVLARLTKISPLKIEFSLTQTFVSYIGVGTPLSFTVENDLETRSAIVYAVESRLDRQTFTVFARALYDNAQERIRPGQSASISVQLDRVDNAIAVPTISSIRELGRRIVYVYDNGRAREVEIQTGMSTAGSLQVIDGLSIGDTLLTTGVMQLRPGMPVTIGEFVPNTAD
jgi:membrane fusion protein (multidrug efflux system)